jgi:hypothetical protein
MKNIEERERKLEEAERIFFTGKKAKAEAESIFFSYHNLIQDIGGDLGEEIMVSILAKNCALIGVDLVLDVARKSNDIDHIEKQNQISFFEKVRQEINNI